MRGAFIWVAILLAISGCAPTVWNKPGVTQTQFSMENAQCQLIAEGMAPPTEAADIRTGSWKKDAAADVGADLASGIVRGIAVSQNYHLCMQAKGYTEGKAIEPQPAGSAQPAPATNAAISPKGRIGAIIGVAEACEASAYVGPGLEAVRAHLSPEPGRSSAAELSDPAFATPDEKAPFARLIAAMHACDRSAIAALSSSEYPPIVPVIEQFLSGEDADATALEAGRMSWGQFNTRRRDRAIQGRQQITQILSRSS